ncbi:hypothetical protein THICB2_610008 [Thiomonas sp. CB2]|nr:hypothetical protein THICB2_610008 [Thiomonas sp. CB2]VDY03907.1 protein of unknown function [Thiomonas sp. Bio17B3]VDY12156.1 conserved protein of unknown function [Thiomonas sp. OC7]
MITSSGRVSGAALHETDCAERSARSGSRCQGCAVRNIALFSALQSADLDDLPLPIDDLQFSNVNQSGGNRRQRFTLPRRCRKRGKPRRIGRASRSEDGISPRSVSGQSRAGL